MTEITDFKELVTNHKERYVDKSLCIPYATCRFSEVILKPPGFGKSVYLSMLNYFFNIDDNAKDLFKDLQIMQDDKERLQYQNNIPTIYLSFKDYTAKNNVQNLSKISLLRN